MHCSVTLGHNIKKLYSSWIKQVAEWLSLMEKLINIKIYFEFINKEFNTVWDDVGKNQN